MENQQRILEKSNELFFRYGLKGVTMDDIARALGMSKKTLYESFTNKKEMINHFTSQYLEEQEAQYCKVVSEAADPVQELIVLMSRISGMFKNVDMRLINELQKYYPEAWGIFLEHKETVIIRDIQDNLKRGISQGLFRSDINIEIISRMRLEQIQMAMDSRIFPAEQFDIKEVHEQLLLQYVQGICTSEGHKLIKKYLKTEDNV